MQSVSFYPYIQRSCSLSSFSRKINVTCMQTWNFASIWLHMETYSVINLGGADKYHFYLQYQPSP